jgi:callose synthase
MGSITPHFGTSFQQHIYSIRGRILETILSLRFFIFQFGVVYHMNASGGSTALLVC